MLKVTGVFRIADNNRVLSVAFTLPPSDDELREFHNYIRTWTRSDELKDRTPNR